MAVMRMGYIHVKVTDLAEAKQHYGSTVGLYETLEQDGRSTTRAGTSGTTTPS
jgi:catechol 2,3-dioxygenase